LLAAIEFGVQPMLFHDESGSPLYAPYPLAIAIPAMMIGHLSFAGLAELIISGGLVAYLQRANPDLLAYSVPTGAAELPMANIWKSTRALWYMLAGLMILSPVGLLAAGTAWGEWGVEDFANAEVRQQILQASGGVAPPGVVPQGLKRLSSVWTAPFPDYAPSFMHSAGFGYFLSAVFGAGLILLLVLLISRITLKRASAKL